MSLAETRVFLKGRAVPSDSINAQGRTVALGRLHSTFAENLGRAVRQAQSEGINVTINSAYRPPGLRIGGYRNKFHSLHAYGLAVDVQGIGGVGSETAKRWHEIASENGLYNPYGVNHEKEFNHFQAVPEYGRQFVEANPQLRAAITAEGPIDVEAMWEASGVPVTKPVDPFGVHAFQNSRLAAGVQVGSDVPTPPASVPEATFADASKAVLRRRRRPLVDNRVKYLQETLNSRFGFDLDVDGQFGPATEAAVKAYQKTAELDEVDGVVGPATWGSLAKAINPTGRGANGTIVPYGPPSQPATAQTLPRRPFTPTPATARPPPPAAHAPTVRPNPFDVMRSQAGLSRDPFDVGRSPVTTRPPPPPPPAQRAFDSVTGRGPRTTAPYGPPRPVVADAPRPRPRPPPPAGPPPSLRTGGDIPLRPDAAARVRPSFDDTVVAPDARNELQNRMGRLAAQSGFYRDDPTRHGQQSAPIPRPRPDVTPRRVATSAPIPRPRPPVSNGSVRRIASNAPIPRPRPSASAPIPRPRPPPPPTASVARPSATDAIAAINRNYPDVVRSSTMYYAPSSPQATPAPPPPAPLPGLSRNPFDVMKSPVPAPASVQPAVPPPAVPAQPAVPPPPAVMAPVAPQLPPVPQYVPPPAKRAAPIPRPRPNPFQADIDRMASQLSDVTVSRNRAPSGRTSNMVTGTNRFGNRVSSYTDSKGRQHNTTTIAGRDFYSRGPAKDSSSSRGTRGTSGQQAAKALASRPGGASGGSSSNRNQSSREKISSMKPGSKKGPRSMR